MVFMTTILFVVAAGVVFLTIQIMTPFLYEMWFNTLRDSNTTDAQEWGDNMFGAWQVMSYVVPGLIILWGLVLANQKRTQDVQRFE